MKKKQPAKVELEIKDILKEKGKGVQVLLKSNRKQWLPKKLCNFGVDDYGRRIVTIPYWLKLKVDKELRNGKK